MPVDGRRTAGQAKLACICKWVIWYAARSHGEACSSARARVCPLCDRTSAATVHIRKGVHQDLRLLTLPVLVLARHAPPLTKGYRSGLKPMPATATETRHRCAEANAGGGAPLAQERRNILTVVTKQIRRTLGNFNHASLSLFQYINKARRVV